MSGGDEAQRPPSEEELRAAYEAELARMHVSDLLAQTVVSLMNMAALRLGGAQEASPGAAGPREPPGPAELEQVRDAIDGARALLSILERTMPEQLKPLRDGLAQLQLAYASRVRTGAAAPSEPPSKEPPGAKETGSGSGAEEGNQGRGPGPAESSGRLWVPGR